MRSSLAPSELPSDCDIDPGRVELIENCILDVSDIGLVIDELDIDIVSSGKEALIEAGLVSAGVADAEVDGDPPRGTENRPRAPKYDPMPAPQPDDGVFGAEGAACPVEKKEDATDVTDAIEAFRGVCVLMGDGMGEGVCVEGAKSFSGTAGSGDGMRC